MNLETLRKWGNSRYGLTARFILSITILFVLFWKVDVLKVFSTFTHIPAYLIAVTFVLYLLVRTLSAYQLSIGIAAFEIKMKLARIFKLLLISDFYSLCLPGRLMTGSAVLWLGLSYSKGNTIKMGTVILYMRLIGLLVIFGIGSFGIFMDKLYAFDMFAASFATLFTLTAIMFFLIFSPKYIHYFKYIVQMMLGDKLSNHWIFNKSRGVYRAIRELNNLPIYTILFLTIISLFVHIVGSAMYYYIALAVGIKISFFTIIWIRALLLIISIVPVTIADLGVREVTLVVILEKYGVSNELALSYSFAIFGVFLMGALLGWGMEHHGMGKSICPGFRKK